jgi:predicted AlkP superfamily pyrophosphatase or phosphodiesterase
MRLTAAAIAALALAAGCSSSATPRTGSSAQATQPAPPPRLVVLLVIDQWPQWAFVAKRPHLHAGGFDRLLREGDWHTGQHPSAATITAPGHALLGTGEPPYHSGILANEWYRRKYDRILKSAEDPDGGPSSARWLRVSGLGDSIAAANTGAKAVSVALKDRAAILMLGHAGLPIWYDKKTVAWASTAATPPPWLAEHNRRAPLSAHLAHRWEADAARLTALSGTTDDQRGETGGKGLGPTFPHDVAATKDPADALYSVPLANGLSLETALAAIDGEQLGADDTPDLLAISLSAHDYIAHNWGHESWEVWDMTLRLDEQLARFLGGLDAKVGPGRWSMIVTSDHGGTPLPERAGTGRVSYDDVHDVANRAAARVFGPGEWIADTKYPNVFLSAAARARPAQDQARALREIVGELRAIRGLARVELTADVAGHCETRTGDAFLICIALDPVESGEIFYLPARGWTFEEKSEPVATAHGSIYDYDREVPVIMLSPGRTPHASLEKPSQATIYMVRIAAVVARWLGVTPPSSLPR